MFFLHSRLGHGWEACWNKQLHGSHFDWEFETKGFLFSFCCHYHSLFSLALSLTNHKLFMMIKSWESIFRLWKYLFYPSKSFSPVHRKRSKKIYASNLRIFVWISFWFREVGWCGINHANYGAELAAKKFSLHHQLTSTSSSEISILIALRYWHNSCRIIRELIKLPRKKFITWLVVGEQAGSRNFQFIW